MDKDGNMVLDQLEELTAKIQAREKYLNQGAHLLVMRAGKEPEEFSHPAMNVDVLSLVKAIFLLEVRVSDLEDKLIDREGRRRTDGYQAE
jgi:hypothetical protein